MDALGLSQWYQMLVSEVKHKQAVKEDLIAVKAYQVNHRLPAFSWHFPPKDSKTSHLAIRMSSIEHDHEREPAEVSADQVVIDGSVGSDTESSKALTSDTVNKDPSDQPHHARSNSVKKPATFKAVSVTKNFLAKAGSTTAPAVKGPGDGGMSPDSFTFGGTC